MRRKYFDKYGCSSRLYNSWKHMKERCNNPSCKDYRNYGDRGITVCEAWNSDFLAFKEWALANGYEEELTIDRVNNDGNYEPSNCRWATKKEQANNKQASHYITYKGETKTLSEWSIITGIAATTIYMRLTAYGWSIEKSLETSVQRRNKNCVQQAE